MELTLTRSSDVPAPAVAMADPETALVRRAVAGDADAFGELVQAHMRRAYYAALGLMGSPDDALDISQEAFVRAWKARGRLDPTRPFYPWLYQILRRLCFNMTRDRGTRRRRLADAQPWLERQASMRYRSDDPRTAVETSEARDRVQRAIAGLSEKDREVLVLKEFEGLKYREIADLVGIPIGTVMSRLYNARRRLAEALEEDR